MLLLDQEAKVRSQLKVQQKSQNNQLLFLGNNMTSHKLALKLLELPDVPVSIDETGEIVSGAEFRPCATDNGFITCIVLEFQNSEPEKPE